MQCRAARIRPAEGTGFRFPDLALPPDRRIWTGRYGFGPIAGFVGALSLPCNSGSEPLVFAGASLVG